MKKVAPTFLLLIAFLAFNSCSIIKKNDPEKKVRTYLEEFEDDLQDSDLVILGHFQVDKSKEVIMKALRIIQNIDINKDSVRCAMDFNSALVFFDENTIRVEVRGKHISLDTSNPLEQDTKFTMWLASNNTNGFKIIKFDAEDLYQDYHQMVWYVKEKVAREKEIASKQIYFAQSRKLRETYDSVIWFTHYQDSIYYYVVNGKWENYFIGEKATKLDSVRMGLVSETGRVIVPPNYNLVGTIGFELPDIVEVRRNNLIGLFSIEGKELVPANYNLIVPYNEGDAAWIVKQDSTYGWFSKEYAYHEGFPSSQAEKYMNEFKYLGKEVSIDAKSKAIAEILSLDHMGFGIVVPSNYLVSSGALSEIVSDMIIGNSLLGTGYVEYVKTTGAFLEQLSDKLVAFVLSLKHGYVSGREGFYEKSTNDVTFMDKNKVKISRYQSISSKIEFKTIDNSLLEVKNLFATNSNEDQGFAGGIEWNIPVYEYLNVAEGVVKLSSFRDFQFTEFVKMDSSYLEGDFVCWDSKSNKQMKTQFLSNETIEAIRNEVLAANGYIFADQEISKQFEYRKWYKPKYGRYKDVIAVMSEIDQHNLIFLENIVGTLDTESVL